MVKTATAANATPHQQQQQQQNPFNLSSPFNVESQSQRIPYNNAILAPNFMNSQLTTQMASVAPLPYSRMTPKSIARVSPRNRRNLSSRLLLRYAVASRCLMLSLIVIWRSLLSSYDTSASINPPCLTSSTGTSDSQAPPVRFPSLGSAIESSIVWDGVYFVRIAECGYEYEQTYAFLPLLPICISILSKTVFAPLVPVIGYRAVLGLSGYVVNNIAFVFAALYFYRLSVIVLKDPDIALRASVLFCFNPASVFYSTIYSESLYALLSFGGLYYVMNGADSSAVFWFALSGCARSNGVLNAGYICFQKLQRVAEAFLWRQSTYLLTVWNLLTATLCSLCIFTPFISFQIYGYSNICTGCYLAEMRPWCKSRLPLLYNYIQSHYWGVGFLKYFQIKQIPNFLLGSPILSLALCSIFYYVMEWPKAFLSLGHQRFSEKNPLIGSSSISADKQPSPSRFSHGNNPILLQDDRIRLKKRAIKREHLDVQFSKLNEEDHLQYNPVDIVPFVLHLSFMSAAAFFVMHVQCSWAGLVWQVGRCLPLLCGPLTYQFRSFFSEYTYNATSHIPGVLKVATRFLSASPPLYWFASQIMGSPGTGKRLGYLMWSYCAAYILLGSLLFSNFYPFT